MEAGRDVSVVEPVVEAEWGTGSVVETVPVAVAAGSGSDSGCGSTSSVAVVEVVPWSLAVVTVLLPGGGRVVSVTLVGVSKERVIKGNGENTGRRGDPRSSEKLKAIGEVV